MRYPFSPPAPPARIPALIPALIVGLAFAMALALGACGPSPRQAITSATSTTSGDPMVQQGAQLVQSQSCLACHSTNGSRGAGPTFKGLAGSQVQLANGRTVTADDSYLSRSIQQPDADIVKGYAKGVMSAVLANRKPLSPQQVATIVAYMKTMKTMKTVKTVP